MGNVRMRLVRISFRFHGRHTLSLSCVTGTGANDRDEDFCREIPKSRFPGNPREVCAFAPGLTGREMETRDRLGGGPPVEAAKAAPDK